MIVVDNHTPVTHGLLRMVKDEDGWMVAECECGWQSYTVIAPSGQSRAVDFELAMEELRLHVMESWDAEG